LADFITDGDAGTVLTLDRQPGSGRVMSLHSDEFLVGWDAFGRAPKYHASTGLVGGLDMPVIR
jgi:hypothetical protein